VSQILVFFARFLEVLVKEEALDFERKLESVKKLEKIERAVGFIFSRSGFTKEAEDYCNEKSIAFSDDERWFA